MSGSAAKRIRDSREENPKSKSEKVTNFVKLGECVVIYCCGGYHTPHRTVFVCSDNQYINRKLEIIICPKCGALVAELTQYNIKTKKYEKYRPKRKRTSRFLKEIESGKWYECKVKYGTKEKAGFVYGQNKEAKDGKIYQYAVDFNGTKRLVKVING